VSPEESRKAEIIQAAIAISRFSGPLPPPEALAQYEQILTGSANRIIRMAEQQATHRQGIEAISIGSNATVQKWGLACAFVIAMTAIGGGIWLSSKGMSGTGLTSIISALVALVGVFVYGKSGQKKELAKKSNELTLTPPTPPTTQSPDDSVR
jgi:uncharacterized membrane protein